MTDKNKLCSIKAMMGAVIVSGFVTTIAAVLPLSLALTLPEGIWRYMTIAVSGIVCMAFFICFGLHAYGVEIDFITEIHEPSDV